MGFQRATGLVKAKKHTLRLRVENNLRALKALNGLPFFSRQLMQRVGRLFIHILEKTVLCFISLMRALLSPIKFDLGALRHLVAALINKASKKNALSFGGD